MGGSTRNKRFLDVIPTYQPVPDRRNESQQYKRNQIYTRGSCEPPQEPPQDSPGYCSCGNSGVCDEPQLEKSLELDCLCVSRAHCRGSSLEWLWLLDAGVLRLGVSWIRVSFSEVFIWFFFVMRDIYKQIHGIEVLYGCCRHESSPQRPAGNERVTWIMMVVITHDHVYNVLSTDRLSYPCVIELLSVY